MEGQVGIVGAGLSGLLACKYVLQMGFTPIVFEARAGVGGVWTQTIETAKLQTVKQYYQFMDFPWPSSVEEDFPDHNQVLDYIESYARHFDLLRYIKFNSRVTSIDYEGVSDEEMSSWDVWGGNNDPFGSKGKWSITVEDTLTQSTEVYQVRFVTLCIGRFSDVPNIPDFPPGKGPEVFDGKVMHSMDYTAKTGVESVKAKRVTVVGIQKSALDIATECAAENGVEHPCTVIFRKAHWNFPDYFPWGVPLTLLYFNRFAELLIHKPGEGFLLSLLATLLSPLRWLRSKFVESYLKQKLPLKKYNMIPDRSFGEDLAACTTAITPEKFYEKVEEGSIVLKKSSGFSFCKNGLMLDDAVAPLETDVVILATGYKGDEKLKDIFGSSTFKDMMSSSTIIQLYRECVHPRIPQLAIIGYSESLFNLYPFEMRCRWLGHLLKGTFKLPRIKEMEMDVKRCEEYMKTYTGEYHRRSCSSLIQTWCNDQLCNDMKCTPRRKNGVLAELFEPYGPMDYADLRPQSDT